MGLPLGLVEKIQGAAEALRTLPSTTFMQNEHDPVGSAKEVRTFVSAHGNTHAAVLAIPGDTHDYADFALITKQALEKAQ